MDEVEIVPAGWRDAWTLWRLDKRSFPPADAYDLLTYLSLCAWPGVIRLKAVVNGRLIGFVAADPRPRRGYTIIVTLAVDPTWRRRGVGERLMRACEAHARQPRLQLQVRKTNTAAIRLYQKLGYAIISDLPHYYSDGGDGFLMEKRRG